jgi:HlyD family secretion protein
MKIKKSYAVIAAIILIGGGYYWYQKAHQAPTAVQYVTAVAEKGTLTTSVSGSGNVIVDQSVNIDPTITGTVSSLAVNIGDKVKKGQILFAIVNDQLGVSADQAQASFLQAKSSVESSEVSVKQAQATYSADKKSGSGVSDKQKSTDKEKIDAAKQALTASQQNLSASQSALQFQLQNAGKRMVTSPMAGTVNAVNIKNGDDLSKLSSGSSRTVPIIIGDLGTLKAQVQINEVDVPNVQLGQKVMMTFSAVNGLTVSGKVEKMDSLGTVTQGVVTYNATISFDSLDQRIKPGMSVSASVITGVKQDVIIVPNSAVKTQSGANYVDVLNSGTTPQQVTVQSGAVNNTDTEIVSGINVGDKVVTRTIAPGTATTSTSTSGGGARIPGIGGGGRFGG